MINIAQSIVYVKMVQFGDGISNDHMALMTLLLPHVLVEVEVEVVINQSKWHQNPRVVHDNHLFEKTTKQQNTNNKRAFGFASSRSIMMWMRII
jgi:hypothetical protein